MDEENDLGIRGAVKRALERVPVRLRESGHTQSAWRLSVDSDEGAGTITLLDSMFYRGDGVFLGWPQEQLARVYEALNVAEDGPRFELSQLG